MELEQQIGVGLALLLVLILCLLAAVGVALGVFLHFKRNRISSDRFIIIDRAVRLDQYTNKQLVDLYLNDYNDLSPFFQAELEKEIEARKLIDNIRNKDENN